MPPDPCAAPITQSEITQSPIARSPIPRSPIPLALACCLLLPALACGSADDRPTVTIYTSIYEHVIAALDPVLGDEFPDIRVRWFQRGSEDVAARLNSEIAANRIAADIVMTSDPFWYEELKEAGHLLEYRSPRAAGIPEALHDPDGTFVTVRMPVMVLAANTTRLAPDERPRSFRELADPRWAGRVAMADPNRSGSAFTAVAALSRTYGWEYFAALRRNDIVAAGGNSAVLNRLVTGEREVGIILLENLLQARERNPDVPVAIIYPDDGAVLVPSPMAILRATAEPEAARRIYDFFLSDAGQLALVGGWMYSPFDHLPAPGDARPWNKIWSAPLVPWTIDYLRETRAAREETRRRFNQEVLERR